MHDDKRRQRDLKRALKKAGAKKRRQALRRGLADHPEEAHRDEFAFGRDSSAGLNGLDRDCTRRQPAPPAESE